MITTNESPNEDLETDLNNNADNTEAKDAVETLPGYQEYLKERSSEHLNYGDY